MNNEQREAERQAILAILRSNETGLTMDMLGNETKLDPRTIERRLRTLRNRKVVADVGGVWFVVEGT